MTYSPEFIEQHREINVFDDWFEYVYETWTKRLEDYGFHGVEIRFTGFWSKGDGASFNADYIDLDQYLRAAKRRKAYRALLDWFPKGYDVRSNVYRNCNYYAHWNTVTTSLEVWNDDVVPYWRKPVLIGLVERLESEIADDVRQFCKDLYNDLRDEYEALTSDTAVIEALEANEIDEPAPIVIDAFDVSGYVAEVLRGMDDVNKALEKPVDLDWTQVERDLHKAIQEWQGECKD